MFMRFSVDRLVLAKEKKKLNGYIFGIIGFAIAAVVMAFTFFSDDVQSLMDEAEEYRRYANLFRGYDYYDEMISNASGLEFDYFFYLFMTFIPMVLLIVYICKYVKKKPIVRNYEKSYIEINGDTITGLAFYKANEEGYPFSVNVSELTHAFYFEKSPLNLKLATRSQSYSCLAIESASELTRQLKQRIAELNEANAEGGKH